MIYYFKAIKSLVDIKKKAKELTHSLSGRRISLRLPSARPRGALPCDSKEGGILILLTELVKGNNGKR